MLKVRFHTDNDDPRPVKWPPKHPFWLSGKQDGRYVIVAYADSEDQIMEYWPEAENLESQPRETYIFSDKFPKPDWFECAPDMIESVPEKAPPPVAKDPDKAKQLLEMKDGGEGEALIEMMAHLMRRIDAIEAKLKSD